jgi:hypothetical protein
MLGPPAADHSMMASTTQPSRSYPDFFSSASKFSLSQQ